MLLCVSHGLLNQRPQGVLLLRRDLSSKLRLVIERIVFEKDGTIRDYQFIGSPAARVEDGQGIVDELTAQTLAKRKAGSGLRSRARYGLHQRLNVDYKTLRVVNHRI